MLLALDWRVSPATIAWAKQKLEAFKDVPTIIATHELLTSANGATAVNDAAELTGYGKSVWDDLIKANDQIFLTLNGHNWPAGRVTMKNRLGRDVFMHLVNYQDRFFSGSGMICLYEFDMRANTVDVKTFSPYWLSKDRFQLPSLAKNEARLTDAFNQLTMEVDLENRFTPVAPVVAKDPLPVEDAIVEGTLAYWRFEGADEMPVASDIVINDLSGNGNDLVRVTLENGSDESMLWSNLLN